MVAFIDFMNMTNDAFKLFDYSMVIGLIMIIGICFSGVNMFLFVRYFCNDNYVTRKNLTVGCFM